MILYSRLLTGKVYQIYIFCLIFRIIIGILEILLKHQKILVNDDYLLFYFIFLCLEINIYLLLYRKKKEIKFFII